jgi:hypothetical protein
MQKYHEKLDFKLLVRLEICCSSLLNTIISVDASETEVWRSLDEYRILLRNNAVSEIRKRIQRIVTHEPSLG